MTGCSVEGSRGTSREVQADNGGGRRLLARQDGMGFSTRGTILHAATAIQKRYKNRLEAEPCVEGAYPLLEDDQAPAANA